MMNPIKAQHVTRKFLKSEGIDRPNNCELCGASTSSPEYHVWVPNFGTSVPMLRPVILYNRTVIVAHHYRGYDHPYDVWFICMSCNRRLQHKHDGVMNLEQARVFVEFPSERVYEVCKEKPSITEMELRIMFADQLTMMNQRIFGRRKKYANKDETERLKIECDAGVHLSRSELAAMLTDRESAMGEYELVPKRLMQTLIDLAVGAHVSGNKDDLITLGHVTRFPKEGKGDTR